MDRMIEVHWHEGMFLRPQHLQVAFGDVQRRLQRESERIRPWSYGVGSIEINNGQLAQFNFEVTSCGVLFPSGTWVCYPENATLDPKNFRYILEERSTRFDVFLGVPRLSERDPNVCDTDGDQERQARRYMAQEEPFYDETTGRNAQMVQTLRLNAQVFFEGESMSGYEAVRIGRIHPTGSTKALPSLDTSFIPPALSLKSWPPLLKLVGDLTNEIRHAGSEMVSQIARRETPFADQAMGGMETALKLQAIHRGGEVLRQMVELPFFHPQEAYLELARIIGDLSVFLPGHQVGPDLPIYDHDDLGTCFSSVADILRQLLEATAPRNYLQRQFEKRRDYLECPLEAEWFAPANRFFVGVRTDRPVEEVRAFMDPSVVKLASPNSVARAVQALVYGIKMVPEERLPPGLPEYADVHYFRLEHEASSDEYWQAVEREKTMAMAGAPIEEGIEYSVYVLLGAARPRRSK